MRKFITIALLLTTIISATAKKTYIPRYTTAIIVAHSGTDTITTVSRQMDVQVHSSDGLFTINVNHDDMTLEKLKQIRANKRAAGWAGFAATLYTIEGTTAQAFTERLAACYNSQVSSILSAIYSANAEVANVLGIEITIDNPSDYELSVTDMERGRTWYILPHQYLRLALHNPDVAYLRIANIANNVPYYAYIAAGSEMKSLDVVYEGEQFIVLPNYVTSDNGSRTISFYHLIDRRTWDQRSMSKEEYKEFRIRNK